MIIVHRPAVRARRNANTTANTASARKPAQSLAANAWYFVELNLFQALYSLFVSQEQCDWKCAHYTCTRKCGEICNRPACNQPCSEKLRCGHPCVGLCGEICPPLCRICHKEQLFESTRLGQEEEANARYDWLNNFWKQR